MVRKAGNSKFLKQYNETAVLDFIRVRKAVSRAELSQLTGLSPTATGIIVGSLMDKGYIHQTGTGESKGGRRPVLLELKPDSFYSVGIDLDTGGMNIVLVDITGKTVHECFEAYEKLDNFKLAVKKMEESVRKVLLQYRIGYDRLLGIGVSVPGMVDSQTHHVILAPNLGWENVDIAGHLEEASGVSVYVENEAMCSAICENWVGCCQDVSDFVCINIKSGIGAGIFAGGRLYRGAGGSAGEVGHIVVDENGPKCGCGNYGCLETVVSTERIVERAQRLVRQGVVSSLNEASDVDSITLDTIIRAAERDDEAARGMLLETARYLGIAISNLVNTLNPSKIVIGKDFTRYADQVMEHIQSIVACKALKYPASKVEIIASCLGDKTSTLGAAIIPLKLLFGR